MEQLQVVLAHLKVHRFWYSLGLAVLFAYLMSGGIADIRDKADKGAKELDNSFNQVKSYQAGDKANAQWKQAVAEKKKVLDEDFLSSHEKLYLDQEKLMTWPKEVADAFKGRPFGAKLDDNQSKYIFDYRRACDDLTQVAQVFWELNVLDKQDDGKLFGVVDVGRSPSAVMTQVIQFPTWTRDPTSMEAWYAQEMLWIQRAIVKSIAKINRSTAEAYTGENAWRNAPIKRMHGIHIGAAGLDQATMATKKPADLIEYPPPDGTPPPAQTSGQQSDEQAVNPKRYIEKTDAYRLVPVSVHLQVDQTKITDVLAGLANTDFKFTIGEVRANYPERVEMPLLLKEAGASMPGRGADNPLYNCVDLDVYGTMRFYEMPKSLKERREKGEKDAAPLEARPTESAAPPTPKGEPKAAADAPKSDAKAAGDAAKAAAPPPADAPKGDGKTEPKPDPKSEPKAEPKKESPPVEKEPVKEAPKAPTETPAGKTDAGPPKDPTAGGGKSDGKKK
jgi:hypothetical protein